MSTQQMTAVNGWRDVVLSEFVNGAGRRIYVRQCPACGQQFESSSPARLWCCNHCRSMAGFNGLRPRRRDRRAVKVANCTGYVSIALDSLDSQERERFGTMARHGWILEHRLVMARSLGRALTPSEVVHHRNGVKWDNSLDNLEVMDVSHHSLKHTETLAALKAALLEIERLRAELDTLRRNSC